MADLSRKRSGSTNVLDVPVTLNKNTTNNPSQKSEVLEFSAKPTIARQFGSQGMVWGMIQEPLTKDTLGLVELRHLSEFSIIVISTAQQTCDL